MQKKQILPNGSVSRRIAAVWLAILLLFSVVLAELFLPEATGDKVYQKSGTTVDASHADQGYVMVKHKKSSKKLKLRVTHGKKTLTYDLNREGKYEAFPLQMGDGSYRFQVFSQVGGKTYSAVSSLSFKVKIEDETLPYLYANQYVNFNADTKAVAEANTLCANLKSDAEKADAVYQYVLSHIVYDYMRALTASNEYLPDLDEVMTNGRGICFDVASLMACMLRSQNVPTKLVIGYADRQYHAWNDVLIDGKWKRYDATAEMCSMSVKKYTVERDY